MAGKVSSGFEQKMKPGKMNQASAPTSAPKGSGKVGGGGSPKHTGFSKGGKVKGKC